MQLVLFSTPKDGAAGFWYWSIPGLGLLLHFNFEEYGFCHFCFCGLLLLPAFVQIVLFGNDVCIQIDPSQNRPHTISRNTYSFPANQSHIHGTISISSSIKSYEGDSKQPKNNKRQSITSASATSIGPPAFYTQSGLVKMEQKSPELQPIREGTINLLHPWMLPGCIHKKQTEYSQYQDLHQLGPEKWHNIVTAASGPTVKARSNH
ncbi:hypothetical protein Nepgr_023045 [Nepenthes gracilis]|uniref:Uncharacterized protein n=1 Tax=Nepenthes gracilis TaxID=150966 RepID=A0AAD3T1C7_NEPGR|nr:hypothetical protein Nepgr_023045 [Nepenthes gracilis]